MPPRRPTPPATELLAFDAPLPSAQERRAAGRALRKITPRADQACWEPTKDRLDPVELLVESNRTRVPELVPLRYARMAASPFAFLRGSALVMAHDLATTPTAGATVRLCGDAHIANFGVFASPERSLTFDLNDFDETFPGPFEWDVKRMAASIAVAARGKGMSRADRRDACMRAVSAYRDWMDRYAQLAHLEVWYSRLDVQELLGLLDPTLRRASLADLRKFAEKDHQKAMAKLTDVIDGRRRIVADPPLIERFDLPSIRHRLEGVLAGYRDSLASDKQALFDRYRFVDFARKVVGVGSVGTRCWIALFQGPNGGPLFLQVKEARDAAPQVALGEPGPDHNGRRVVEGQRMLQAVSDVLLGWGTDEENGVQYYGRQLWDKKGSFDVEPMGIDAFRTYAWTCGWALAHAHARTGDSALVGGYLGKGDKFPAAITDFAEAYADQTERDHAALLAAIRKGVVPTTTLR